MCSNLHVRIREILLDILLYRFDVDLPEFHTKDGVIRHPDGVSITSPTLMWVKALDLMLMQLSSAINVSDIRMVSGTAQQHGSVYWKRAAEITLSHLNSNGNMADQLQVGHVLFRKSAAKNILTFHPINRMV